MVVSEEQPKFGWYGDEHGAGVKQVSDEPLEIGAVPQNRMKAHGSE